LEDINTPYRSEIALEDGRIFNAQLTTIKGVGLAVTMQDITHLKELDRIKSDFVSTVSHDLRSPLTAILGYIDLIERSGSINERQREYIHRVRSSVRGISDLISDLLDLGRIESGFDAHKMIVSVSAILHYSVDNIRNQLEEKNQKLELDIFHDLPNVSGDETRLRQMIDNLLSNASKYSPVGGVIRVSARHERDQIIIQVSDTGYGIPLSDQPYIFDKFFRAANVDEDILGTGLGLAIVKSIVENHQGRIWVESALGEGTKFTVVLPTMSEGINPVVSKDLP
jgi:two-component system NtrC family sensor kinase